MTIDDRINQHEAERHKLWERKERLEAELSRIEEKIMYHWAAIQNLTRKKLKLKIEDV